MLACILVLLGFFTQIIDIAARPVLDARRIFLQGFFDFFLKGKGHGLRVVPPAAEVIPREKVMFFRKGRRSAEVCSIPEYLARRGAELKESLAPATEPLVWRLIFKRQIPGQAA